MGILRLLGYVIPTVLLVAYSQIVIKWRLSSIEIMQGGLWEKGVSLLKALFDPYIASGFIAAFLGALAWLAAISKIPLNVGFPAYYGLTFAFVILGSSWILDEQLTSYKLAGIVMILVGVVVGSMD